MKIVVAYSESNNGIASSGVIPWNIPEDLKLFRTITSGHTVVMGRKTWESIGSKPLPNRRNIVLSRFNLANIETISSLKEAPKDSVIIGGGQVYLEALNLNLVDTIVATVVKKNYNCDVFFPQKSFWFGDWKQTNVLSNDLFDLILYTQKANQYIITLNLHRS